MFYKLEYTDNLPAGRAGHAKFWFIKIIPEYKDDLGLINHEIYHVSEFWHNPLYPILYTWIKSYRLRSEVGAYKVQLKYYDDDRTKMFAGFICDNYGLDVSKEDVIKMLRENK